MPGNSMHFLIGQMLSPSLSDILQPNLPANSCPDLLTVAKVPGSTIEAVVY